MTGERCPDVAHAPRTIEETQAWDVLLSCVGQTRVAPTGHRTGFDLGAVLALMRTKGCDSPEVLELVQAGELAMVAAQAEE